MSKRNLARITAALFLALGVIAAGEPSVLAEGDPTLLVATPGGLQRTDGKAVVWAEATDPTFITHDIYAANLNDRQKFPVATGAANQTNPDIDGETVVWTQAREGVISDAGDIRGKNLRTGAGFIISAGSELASRPSISGNTVVWMSTGDKTKLMARDILSMSQPFVVAQIDHTFLYGPRIDGPRIVWEDRQVGGASRLFTSIIGSGNVSVIGGDARGGFDLAGDIVVYSTVDALNVVDVRKGVTETIPVPALYPATDGRYVFFELQPLTSSPQGWHDLWGYDLGTNSAFPVSVQAGINPAPALRGGILTWSQGAGAGTEIHAARVADLLLSGRRPAPDTSSSDVRYFPETGHTLALGFKYFWDHSGGLPVFGYPLTEEFQQENTDTGKLHTVQYFERQRFEYHPEFKGTPYETELGRLGAEEAASEGITNTGPFQRVTASSPSSGDSVFFPETGHWLSQGFLSYWQSHGLDFGDPGISFRESLALFGYPISEEFTDPQTGLNTQYFERAVFEYHPDNPDSYKVLLRRLGASLLIEAGWQ